MYLKNLYMRPIGLNGYLRIGNYIYWCPVRKSHICISKNPNIESRTFNMAEEGCIIYNPLTQQQSIGCILIQVSIITDKCHPPPHCPVALSHPLFPDSFSKVKLTYIASLSSITGIRIYSVLDKNIYIRSQYIP